MKFSIRHSPELQEIADMKCSAELGDECDTGFGQADIEEMNFEGCVRCGLDIAEIAIKRGLKHEAVAWEIEQEEGRLYFVGPFTEVRNRLMALKDAVEDE